jgi:outer membrane protein OmpA-like peptidoglycan-associated protein
MPAGFGSILGNIPGIGGLLGSVPGLGTATAAVSSLTGAASGATAATAAAATAATAAATGGIGRIIPWLLGAALIAGLGYYFLGRGKAPEAVAPAVVEEPAAPVVVEAPVANAAVDTCNADFDKAMDGKSINFATGKATINADSADLVAALASVATSCGTFKIEVAGHTDVTGNAAANKTLSQARAAAVVAALAAKGVAAAQMTAVGYGAEKPVDAGMTPEAHAKNRRIDFTVSQ